MKTLAATRVPWWREGVLYQIYVRSFADSNGDGIGDLPGIRARLDHLARLGVDAVWLSPIHPSPNADWGYDVADYLAVHPDLGTLADLDDLLAAARERGIRVLLDLVPNHTSDRHPWFVDARSGREARHRSWYVWADPAPGGGPPNNWVSSFGGPAWTLDPASGQYYLHNFLPGQPDLDWWNPEVRAAFEEILAFWLDRGVGGFRIDVCHLLVKNRELRDNPPATQDDPPQVRLLGQRPVFNGNQPEAHDVLRSWRRIAARYDPPRLLLGEAYVFELARMAEFYGRGDELDLAFNFPFLFAPFDPARLAAIVAETESTLPWGAWPVWTASNHDAGRFATRWCDGDPALVRCALLVLLALRGTPVLYYGDEIGMPQTPLRREDLRDPVGVRFWPGSTGRDPGRTPMHWSSADGAGFTAPGVTPWLPLGDHRACNVADQETDPDSVLSFCRALVRLRRARRDLRSGAYAPLPSPPGSWAWRRGESTLVALNLGAGRIRIESGDGRILVATRRKRTGEAFRGRMSLDPGEGAIAELGNPRSG